MPVFLFASVMPAPFLFVANRFYKSGWRAIVGIIFGPGSDDNIGIAITIRAIIAPIGMNWAGDSFCMGSWALILQTPPGQSCACLG